MHWFGGSIAEAVNLYKQKNAIFVVFVEGNNSTSVEMAATLNSTEVERRLSNESNFLAINIKSDSPNYMQFVQIYQLVPVPSLFFIGRNGTPLEVVCAGVDPNSLAARIDRIVEEHFKTSPPSSVPQPSSSSQGVRGLTESLIQSEAQAASKEAPNKTAEKHATDPKETSPGPAAKLQKTEPKVDPTGQYEVVCDGDVCVRKPIADKDAGTSQTSTPTSTHPAPSEPTEEQIERAKKLIEMRKKEKEEKEKQLEREKELERRSTGQGVAELKRWQQEQEMKQLQEERKRERQENNLARQRVLAQIAQDREERRAREAVAGGGGTVEAAEGGGTAAVPAHTVGDSSGRVRVQFKLPDGAALGATFAPGDSLGTVRTYVAENVGMSPTEFTLWTAFPRRELTSDSDTLLGLQLVPSAALLVLPTAGARSITRPDTTSLFALLSTLFASLLAPARQLWLWVSARLWGAPPTPRGVSLGEEPRGGPRHRPTTNIHRLRGDSSADDDNNTWNGNSTQQM